MRRLGQIILASWIPLLIAVMTITSVLLMSLPQIEMRDDETTWLSKDDPALVNYHRFQTIFGNQDYVIVAYESADPFKKSEIAYLSDLTKTLEQLPYIAGATSLTTVKDVTGPGRNSLSRPLLELSDAPRTETQRSRLEDKISSNPFVDGTLISGNRKTVGIVLKIDKAGLGSDVNTEIARSLQRFLDKEQTLVGRQFYFGGGPISDGKINEIIENDMVLFTLMALMLSGVLLFIIFRNWTCVLFPLCTVSLGLLWTFGLKAAVDSPITPVSSALVALVIIIGVANSVHFISHYRLELSRYKDTKVAMLDTYARAGKPCLFTSLTTAAGFGSLALSPIPAIRNLGIFAAFGIISTYLLSMFIVPVGLRLARRLEATKRRHARRWEWLGKFAIHNSKWLIALALLLVIGMGLSSFNIQVEGSMLQYLKANSAIRQSADFLDERLSGSSSMEVVITGDHGAFKTTEVLREIEHFQRVVENYPAVAGSLSIVDYIKLTSGTFHQSAQGNAGIPATKREVDWVFRFLEHSDDEDIDNYYVESLDGDVARVSIKTRQMDTGQREKLMAGIDAFTSANLPGFDWQVTGSDELIRKVTSDIVRTQILSLGLALLVILGLIGLLFGLRGVLASILPNIIPLAAVFGLMGYAGFRLNIATITIASIAIGLVVDDTIHYFSHFRANLVETGDAEQAVIGALQDVGDALCFTTIILSLGFAIFTLSESAFLVEFGILSVVAMVLALVGDILIGPAILSRFNIFKKE